MTEGNDSRQFRREQYRPWILYHDPPASNSIKIIGIQCQTEQHLCHYPVTEAHRPPQTQKVCSYILRVPLLPPRRLVWLTTQPQSLDHHLSAPGLQPSCAPQKSPAAKKIPPDDYKAAYWILSGKLCGSPYKGSAPLSLCRQQEEGLEGCSQAGKHCPPCCCAPLGW